MKSLVIRTNHGSIQNLTFRITRRDCTTPNREHKSRLILHLIRLSHLQKQKICHNFLFVKKTYPVTRLLSSSVIPASNSGRMFVFWVGSPTLSWSPSSWRTCCRIVQMISARPSHLKWFDLSVTCSFWICKY